LFEMHPPITARRMPPPSTFPSPFLPMDLRLWLILTARSGI